MGLVALHLLHMYQPQYEQQRENTVKYLETKEGENENQISLWLSNQTRLIKKTLKDSNFNGPAYTSFGPTQQCMEQIQK